MLIPPNRYQRAYLDFFEDELVKMGYNWREVAAKYLLAGPNPLIHGAIGGLGHPLIHLGVGLRSGVICGYAPG